MAQRDPGLAVFVPRCLGPLLRRACDPSARTVEGTVLFCDVSGFTPMTEALSVLGKEGAEELTRVLNTYFTRMIGLIEKAGGDVLRFGGDAMTVLFEGPPRPRPYRASLEMMAAMGEFANIQTRAGSFTLTMKIGAAHGEVLVGLLGDADTGRDYYAAGAPLDDAAEAEHHASPGLVVLHPTCTLPVGALEVEPAAEGFVRLRAVGGAKGPSPAPRPPIPGKALSGFIPAWLAERAGADTLGEHRGTSVVFLALSGFDWEDLAIHGRIDGAFRVLASAARKYGGVLNKMDMGDKGAKGILLFGAPYALERKEEMATRAALECLASPGMPEGLTLKAGVTSAPLFSGPVGAPTRREFTVMGDGINLAARLMGAAKAGQVLASRPVREASTGVAFEDLGAIRVKGKAEPVEVFAPTGEATGQEAAPERALVEREESQEALRRHLFGEEDRPIALLGGAGLGKTALARWAYREAKLREIPAAYVPLAPYSAESPLSAWRGVVRQALGLRRGDSAEAARAARERGLAHEEAGFRPALNPLLGLPEEDTPSLKGLSPKERQDLSFAMVERLLAKSGERVVLLDGLQWADPLSLDLLRSLLASPESRPWRLVAFAREALPALQGEPWDVAALLPLSDGGVRHLLVEGHGLYEVPEKVLGWFQQRAHGNPGTAAALLESLRRSGLVVPGPAGRPQVDEDRLFKTSFPDTLEGLYLQRVDRLPAEARRALQDAAVLGYSVSGNLLIAASALAPKALEAALAKLLAEELLRDDTKGERPYFAFAVPLVRDAVYAAVPFAQRRAVHAAALAFLESEGLAERPGAWPALAHHAEQAEDAERARRYHRLAGRDALKRYDNQTALRHLEFLCRDLSPESEAVEDALNLMDVYGFLGHREGASALLERLGALDERLSPSHRARLRYFRAQTCWQSQRWDEAEALLKESLALYESCGDTVGVGKTLVNLVGGVYGPTGRMEEARQCLERALGLPKGRVSEPYQIIARMNLGAVLKHSGQLQEATDHIVEARRIAGRQGQSGYAAMAGGNLAGLWYERGDYQKAVRSARKALFLAEALHLRGLCTSTSYNLALALLAGGSVADAQDLAARARRYAQQQGSGYWEGQALQALAQAAFLGLHFKEGLHYVEESSNRFRLSKSRRDELFVLAEKWRLLLYLGCDARLSGEIAASGGMVKLLDEGHRFGLPPSFFAILGQRSGDRTSDPDTLFLNILSRGLHIDGACLPPLSPGAPHELRVRYAWINFVLGGERELTAALRLCSRGAGGLFGLRLRSCIYQDLLTHGDAVPARKVRGLALRQLYELASHSPSWVWERILTFPEIGLVVRGQPRGRRWPSKSERA